MTMKIQLLLMVLLGVVLAAPPTELRAKGGVIYNDAAMDSGTVRDWVYGPALTFEVRLDTVSGWKELSREQLCMSITSTCDTGLSTTRYHETLYDTTYLIWRLYVTQTIGDTVRRFRLGKLDLVNP